MANILTGIRILCALSMLFCPALSPPFYALYVVAGLTDMIDGAVARRTHTASAFGAKLDSIADCALVVVCLIKLIPALSVPAWLCIWISVIALIKAVNIASGYVMQKRLVAPHTAMNRITGALLFVLPLALPVIDLRTSGTVACMAATFAAIQEGHIIRKGVPDDNDSAKPLTFDGKER